MSVTHLSERRGFRRVRATIAGAALAVVAALPALAQSVTQLNDKLFAAVRANDMAAVTSALTAGADPNAVNGDGQTPAGLAVDLGNFPIAHYILGVRNQRLNAKRESQGDGIGAVAPAVPPAVAVVPPIDRSRPEPNWRTSSAPGQPAEIPTPRLTSPRDAVTVTPAAPAPSARQQKGKQPATTTNTAKRSTTTTPAPAKGAVATTAPAAMVPPAPPPLPAGAPNPFDPGVPVMNAPPVLATPATAASAAPNLIDPGTAPSGGGFGGGIGRILGVFGVGSNDKPAPPKAQTAEPQAAATPKTVAEPARLASVAPPPSTPPPAPRPVASALATPRTVQEASTPPAPPPQLPAIKAAPKREAIVGETLPPLPTPQTSSAVEPAPQAAAEPAPPVEAAAADPKPAAQPAEKSGGFFAGITRIFTTPPRPAPIAEPKAEPVAAVETSTTESKPGFFSRLFSSAPKSEPTPPPVEAKVETAPPPVPTLASEPPAPPAPPVEPAPQTAKIATPRALMPAPDPKPELAPAPPPAAQQQPPQLAPQAAQVAAVMPTPPVAVPALPIEPPPVVTPASQTETPKADASKIETKSESAAGEPKSGGFFSTLFHRAPAPEASTQPFDAKASAPAELPTVEDKTLTAPPPSLAAKVEEPAPVAAAAPAKASEESGVGHFFRSMFAKPETPKAPEPTPIPPAKLVEPPVLATTASVAPVAPVAAPLPVATPTGVAAPAPAQVQLASADTKAEVSRPERVTLPPRRAPSGPVRDTLAIGETMSLDRPFKEPAPGDTSCFHKGRQPGWYCLEAADWADDIRGKAEVDSWLYAHARTIVHYEGNKAESIFTVFPADNFNQMLTYLEARFGPAQLDSERFVPLVGEPAKMNATATWTRKDASGSGGVTMEMRKYDNVRGMIPDPKLGFIRLYRNGSSPIFRYVTESDLMLQSLKMQDGNKLR